jgi:hypothetical protein
MRPRKCFSSSGLFLLCLALAGAGGCAKDTTPPIAAEQVGLKPIHFAELSETIRQHKGKVVVVNFWAEY